MEAWPWVAADFADFSGGRGGGFRTHGCACVDSGAPVECLIDQRDGVGAAAAENDCADGDAFGIFPGGSMVGHCDAGAVKRALGWAALRPVSLAISGVHWIALPVLAFFGRLVSHALPPDAAFGG